MAMRSAVMLGTSSSSFSGKGLAARSSSAVSAAPRAVVVSVEATRQCKKCDLTGGLSGRDMPHGGMILAGLHLCVGSSGSEVGTGRGMLVRSAGLTQPAHREWHKGCCQNSSSSSGSTRPRSISMRG